ncbi:hypothetical protein OESDEN_10120 [Oesophagostomum dentatum]|uniref:Uncharacterized protein n=1 Tax=Oesophagostomum dentatum TaxID=61180 RepID=A0A0B1SXL4_OESDE|nr:hypothetical protein OESDEN_10120 [Oesophagostomum dentatum]
MYVVYLTMYNNNVLNNVIQFDVGYQRLVGKLCRFHSRVPLSKCAHKVKRAMEDFGYPPGILEEKEEFPKEEVSIDEITKDESRGKKLVGVVSLLPLMQIPTMTPLCDGSSENCILRRKSKNRFGKRLLTRNLHFWPKYPNLGSNSEAGNYVWADKLLSSSGYTVLRLLRGRKRGHGTGAVTSVPFDSLDDYAALVDLKKKKKLLRERAEQLTEPVWGYIFLETPYDAAKMPVPEEEMKMLRKEFLYWAEQLTEPVWGYIFLETPYDAAKMPVPEEEMKMLRKEFLYWYPIDMRASEKDLVQNHLTFLLFNHVLIWPNKPELWPKSIRANGHLLLNNEKDAGDGVEDVNFVFSMADAGVLRLYSMIDWVKDMIGSQTAAIPI